MKWVYIEEALPNNRELVLVSDDKDFMHVCYFRGFQRDFVSDYHHFQYKLDILEEEYGMPLIKKPIKWMRIL